MRMRAFPDFGAELRRPFEIHEACYDCAALYDGCKATPETNRPLRCARFTRLPDVKPGEHGQTFPPARHKAQDRRAPASDRQPDDAANGTIKQRPVDAVTRTGESHSGETPAKEPRRREQHPSPAATPGTDGERFCECGDDAVTNAGRRGGNKPCGAGRTKERPRTRTAT